MAINYASGPTMSGCACCRDIVAGNPARRRFLGEAVGALALGAAALAGGPASAAQARATRAAARPASLIDVHHHYFPAAHREATRRLTQAAPGGPDWSVAKSLDEMDRTGVQTSMLSLQIPGVWMGGAEESRKIARICNDEGARIVGDHRGRFGLFASIPVPDAEGSLREMAYAYDVLKADGIALLTSYDGKYLGDPAFDSVLRDLDARGAVCFVHPTVAPCCGAVVPGVSPNIIEYATDTSRTIASLLFSGQAAKYFNMKFIFSHSGGTFPFLTGRLIRAAGDRDKVLPGWPMPLVRRFYYEVAQGNTPGQLAALMKMVGSEQVLLGTDYPFRPIAEAADGLGNYPFTPAQLRAIRRDNALGLLPRLRTRA